MAVNVTVKRSARPREYLTEREIEKLIKASGENRWGHRDATAILIAYRHGLRSSELNRETARSAHQGRHGQRSPDRRPRAARPAAAKA